MRKEQNKSLNPASVMVNIRGTVQGVGFRPFIYRLANELNLCGYVKNTSAGVIIQAEGEKASLDQFLKRINSDKPSICTLSSFEFHFCDPSGSDVFSIAESEHSESASALIMPDIATCPDCLREMNDPKDRRYQYPFINCTNCGPRFSIIESLPYDRPNTSMKTFEMCPDCRREYEDPSNRRFHAQPIACPVCGPKAELWDSKGNVLRSEAKAITDAASAVLKGHILALKGIGGFQLIADARNSDAVKKLRQRKLRQEKPFAIMVPDIEYARSICRISDLEETLLQSPSAPIVILKRKEGSELKVVNHVAPGNPSLGVMLPYSPLHHLLIKHLKIPVIATSANMSEEPMCIDEQEALSRLKGIADFYLVHNRPIVRHLDDSVVRVINGRNSILRRARGFAPLPLSAVENEAKHSPVLAMGAHLKNSIAISKGSDIFVSQHIGDLSGEEASKAFTKVINDFGQIYDFQPKIVVTDMHPDYLSTKYAENLSPNIMSVQHHQAHVISCRAENDVKGKALGIAWDGTGYGTDGTVWGGEFFLSGDDACEHIARFLQFPLPGGEAAVKEPRRSALGMLYKLYGNTLFQDKYKLLKNFSKGEIPILYQILNKGINTPLTSSAGRIFDAVASILGMHQRINFEGQAAMSLEHIADGAETASYGFGLIEGDVLTIDWSQMLAGVLQDIENNIPRNIICAKFHNFLADVIVMMAKRLKLDKVILSGGCFQNVLLTEKSIRKLSAEGIKAYWHQQVPPNDGGIAYGQLSCVLMKERNNII